MELNRIPMPVLPVAYCEMIEADDKWRPWYVVDKTKEFSGGEMVGARLNLYTRKGVYLVVAPVCLLKSEVETFALEVMQDVVNFRSESVAAALIDVLRDRDLAGKLDGPMKVGFAAPQEG
jgi:hypothetical protein